MNGFQLRDLAAPVRLSLTLLMLVTLGGFAASLLHMQEHHQNRDGQEGLAYDDLQGAYHGVHVPSPLKSALERGHPETLDARQRELLDAWLSSDRISEDFDNLDLGDDSPQEILIGACLECHARTSSSAIAETVPLDYWDDVKAVAFERSIDATDEAILLASTHTHAIALATITLLIAGLMLGTRWPAALSSSLILVAGLGLSTDLAAWWLARSSAGLVGLIIVAGAAYSISMVLMMLAVIADLWRPVGRP